MLSQLDTLFLDSCEIVLTREDDVLTLVQLMVNNFYL